MIPEPNLIPISILAGFALLNTGLWYACFLYGKIKRRSADSEILLSYPVLFAFKIALACLIVFNFRGAFSENFRIHWWWSKQVSPVILPIVCYFIGQWDDRKGLSGVNKLGWLSVVWLVATVLLFADERQFVPSPAWFQYAGFFICGMAINLALPLIDGINGLFAGFCALTIPLFGTELPSDCCSIKELLGNNPSFQLSWMLFACLCLFVPWNIASRKIRMGEAAVMSVSFYLAFHGARWSTDRVRFDSIVEALIVPGILLLIFAIPLFDFFLIVLCRALNHRSPFAAGHDHLHHRLIQSGWSANKALFMMLLPSFWLSVAVMTRSYYLLNIFDPVQYEIREKFVGLAIPYVILIHMFMIAYLFWRGYTKVNPYQSGAVNERGRP